MKRIDLILHTEKLTGLSLRTSKDIDLGRIYGKAAERQVCLIVDGGLEESYPERSGMIRIHEAVSLKEAKKWLFTPAGLRSD